MEELKLKNKELNRAFKKHHITVQNFNMKEDLLVLKLD